MGIENRPYIGTWRLGRQGVVQYTPDALVYINGSMTLPGCAKCNGKINFQEFITEVSVDAGTDPGASSASFTLSVPVHHHASFARDAQFMLRPGLEVHIYERGYFPVSGLYSKTNAFSDIGASRDDSERIRNLAAYPYYHVFHGVVIQVGCSYSAGVQSFSVQCASMLHFWQYQQVSTNASIFGPRALNSYNKTSLIGHNYTAKHPYEIIWHLHNDFVSAAAGVAYTLSRATNQSATYGSETLFSLSARYWEERFKTRSIKLRMHGASGALFNNAMAAFIGRASSQELLSLTKNRFNAGGPVPNPAGKVLSTTATYNALIRQGNWDALLFLKNSSGGEGSSLELNIVEMKAFLNDIGAYGQVNLFESTYESKLDMALKVCEVTGFEFYQDVDGDFVFKPPFYNMDTSTSRVYRIEDIDIISINFDEKEPQVTYMVAKGGQIKNTVGVGVENEWGVSGQFIDYRLVAQFGWRPGSFETAYFNDPSSMFFAASNRLDIMNAPSKSATVTIPIRPELRPGFPVYIPYLDCYYYCNSFSHSYVVGGQCTTTLQLIAKRAKFFAPGRPEIKGIDAITLDNPYNPPRPLMCLDDAGRPILRGFPNVVMALDPSRVDPRLLMLGTDVFDLNNPATLPGIIRIALDMKLISYQEGDIGGTIYVISKGTYVNETFYFAGDESNLAPNVKVSGEIPPTIIGDITVGADELNDIMADMEGQKKEKREQIKREQAKVVALYQQLDAIPVSETAKRDVKQREINLQIMEITRLQGEYNKLISAAEEKINKSDSVKTKPMRVLWDLIRQINGNKEYGDHDLSSVAFLLDVLANKKAIYTNGSLPGMYRYYSCSHPRPEHQGLPYMTITQLLVNAGLDKTAQGLPSTKNVDGYIKNYTAPQGLGGPYGGEPEAELGRIEATQGVAVLTGNPSNPSVVTSTDEIYELMFSPMDFKLNTFKQQTIRDTDTGALSAAAWKVLKDNFLEFVLSKGQDPDTVIIDVVEEWHNKLEKIVVDIATKIAGFSMGFYIKFSFSFYGAVVDMNEDTPNTFIKGTKKVRSDGMNLDKFWRMLTDAYFAANKAEYGVGIKAWCDEVLGTPSLGDESKRRQKVTEFFVSFYGAYGIPYAIITSQKTQKKGQQTVKANGPVFPVSDGLGYEIIGSWRYGRGVDIDSTGVFAELVSANPLNNLDSKTIDDFVNGVLRGRQTLSGARVRNLIASLSKQYTSDGAIQSLNSDIQNLTDEDIERRGALVDGLRNVFINHVRDAVAKTNIQLTNSAYTIAELSPFTNLQTCECKAAEANVVLENANDQANYIPVVEGFMSEMLTSGPVTRYLTKSTAGAGSEWVVHQEALRGEVLDTEGSSLLESIENLDEELAAAQEQTRRDQEALNEAGTAVEEAAENVRGRFS